jgi:hypothetical protein
MITFKLRFSFHESHKSQYDVSYREREFTVKNEDEKKGFLDGLYAGIGTVYLDFEEIIDNVGTTQTI